MATLFTHPVVAVALASLLPRRRGAQGLAGRVVPWQLIAVGAACACLPDADVAGLGNGIPYGAPLGHRGLSHSLLVALLVGGLATLACMGLRARLPPFHAGWLFAFLAAATASHGLLDALTDGGHGVALLAPITHERYFAPWRPIAVSPVGLDFFSDRAWRVVRSELLWVWLPSAGIVVAAWGWRRLRGPRPDAP